jgi:gluconolactonase
VVDTSTATLTTHATVNYWLEGPVWVPGNPGHLIFSSINFNYADSNNRLRKLVLPNTVTDFLVPPPYTVYNGTTVDAQERLISCQSGSAGLQVVIITDGVVTPLVSRCAGLKFYSPNDVVVKSDGTIWFTDPGFNGVTQNPPVPGHQPGHYVYQFDPANGNDTCTPVITNVFRPNGLCFSPDERLLYLADYDARAIRVYSVSSSNTLSGGSIFATLPTPGTTHGNPDGIRCDVDGRVYSSSKSGIWMYMPDGRLIGRIMTNATVGNLCFGGAEYRTLFIAAQPDILSIPLKVPGAVALRKLGARRDGGLLQLSWPAPSTGFRLQTSDSLGAHAVWTDATNTPHVANGMNHLGAPATGSAEYYRLQMQ